MPETIVDTRNLPAAHPRTREPQYQFEVDMALRDIESTVRRGRAFVRIGVIPRPALRWPGR